MVICDKIKAELQDEIKARSEYTELAEQADRAGMHDVASSLRGIANDEARHRAILGGIINEPGRCMMAQDPNISKLKISEECKTKVADLIGALLLTDQAMRVIRDDPPKADSLTLVAKTYVDKFYKNLYEGEDVDLSKILGGLEATIESIASKELANGYTLLNNVEQNIIQVLLDTAVDCECREAKAAYEQLGSAALQTVLEPGEEATGRPRRYTEIPGEN